MDLMPENPIQPEKKRNKLKISLIFVVITMLILVVVAIVIYVYTLSIPKEKSLKIYFDNVVKTTEKNQNMFLLPPIGGLSPIFSSSNIFIFMALLAFSLF